MSLPARPQARLPATPNPNYDLGEAGGDYALRAEMGAQEFLLRNWMPIVGVVGSVVVGFLVYGWWGSATIAEQRATTAAIADVERDLPSGMLQLAQARAGMGEPPEAAAIVDEADALVAIGDGATGTSAVEAWMKAAELYRMADRPDARRGVLEKAAAHGSGVLAFAARSALANLDLEADKVDEGLAALESLTTVPEPFLARQATLELAAAQEATGRPDAARATYDRFLTTWPDAPEAETATERKARVGSAAVAAAAPVDATPEAEAARQPGRRRRRDAGRRRRVSRLHLRGLARPLVVALLCGIADASAADVRSPFPEDWTPPASSWAGALTAPPLPYWHRPAPGGRVNADRHTDAFAGRYARQAQGNPNALRGGLTAEERQRRGVDLAFPIPTQGRRSQDLGHIRSGQVCPAPSPEKRRFSSDHPRAIGSGPGTRRRPPPIRDRPDHPNGSWNSDQNMRSRRAGGAHRFRSRPRSRVRLEWHRNATRWVRWGSLPPGLPPPPPPCPPTAESGRI